MLSDAAAENKKNPRKYNISGVLCVFVFFVRIISLRTVVHDELL